MAPAETALVPSGPAVAHLRALLEQVPYASCRAVSRLAGLSNAQVCQMERDPTPTVSLRVARAVMGVGAQELRAVSPVRVPRKMVQQIRSMQFHGWDLACQAERLGCSPSYISGLATGRYETVSREFAAAVDALARWVEGGRGGLRTGPNPLAAARAARAGWQGLLAYDAEGRLLPEAVRDEEAEAAAEERETWARVMLQVLRISLTEEDKGPAQIAEDLKVSRTFVDGVRIRKGGLRFETRKMGGGWVSRVRPESLERAEEIRAALRDYEADPSVDAFDVACRLGLMEP